MQVIFRTQNTVESRAITVRLLNNEIIPPKWTFSVGNMLSTVRKDRVLQLGPNQEVFPKRRVRTKYVGEGKIWNMKNE